jgi:predicted amidohydrolase
VSSVRAVAVQLQVELGQPERNLRHIEDVVRQAAREHQPDMILLPESAETPNVYHRAMRRAAGPVDGSVAQTLKRLAREHGCMVGGGFIAVRGDDARGTYCLAEPDGAVHLHDKDQPSMWENNYYAGGSDDGVFATSLGPIGCANGFEWVRSRTAARLRGRVRMLGGGMCFPSFPTWRLTRRYFWDRDHAKMVQWARETPPRMARVLGVPCVHPSHVGDVTMETILAPGVPWPTVLIGETQICDARGTILEHMAYEDGEGYVAADLELGEPRPLDAVPPHFWMTTIPVSVEAIWLLANAHGRLKYEAMKALRMHRWQRRPDA